MRFEALYFFAEMKKKTFLFKIIQKRLDIYNLI